MAALLVMLQILTLKLGNWVGHVVTEMSVFSGDLVCKLETPMRVTSTILVLFLAETFEIIVKILSVLYPILEVILRDVWNIINKLCGVISPTGESDIAKHPAVDRNMVAQAAEARMVIKNKSPNEADATARDRHSGSLELENQKEQRPSLHVNAAQLQTVVKPDVLDVTQTECIDTFKNKTTNVLEKNECNNITDTNVKIIKHMHQSNIQTVGEPSKTNTNTASIDSVFPGSEPSAEPTVSSQVDNLAKWRKERFFADGQVPAGTTETPEEHVSCTESNPMAEIWEMLKGPDDNPPVSQHARRTVNRETRARKPMERQAAAKGDETQDRRPRSANAKSDAPEPAPSSERAREMSRDGPPCTTDATSDFRRQDRNRNFRQTTCHGRRQIAGYRAWVPPQTTRVYDTSVSPTAVPPPPGPGRYWYGRQKFGPFVGPLMWNPVHERPRSFEMPATHENEAAAAAPATRGEAPAAPGEMPAAAQQPFFYHVPGYLDGVGPVWYKVTVTP